MAFFNCFLNFNINFTQPNFGFNFGCFSMPNFFSNMPLFNFPNFSTMPPFLQYPSPTNFNMPSVFSGSSFNMPTMNFNSGFNMWQTSPMPMLDTFNWSSGSNKVQSSSTKSNSNNQVEEAGKNFTYNNNKDIYAKNNAAKMKKLTSGMQEKTKKLIAYANAKGYDVYILSGYRSQAEQDALRAKYEAQGQYNRAAKVSPHTSRKAIDIRVYKNGKRSDAGYNLLGKYAVKELGMRWGGNFKNWMVEKWHFDYGWR